MAIEILLVNFLADQGQNAYSPRKSWKTDPSWTKDLKLHFDYFLKTRAF